MSEAPAPEPNSESAELPPPATPADLNPPPDAKSGRAPIAAGATVIGGGCLLGVIALVVMTISILTILGDILTGASIPGHGPAEIDNQVALLDNMSGLLVFALICVVVGVVLLVKKRKK